MLTINWKSDDEILKGNIARLFEFLRQEDGQILYENYLRGLDYFLSHGIYKLTDFGSNTMELKKFRRAGSFAILRKTAAELSEDPTNKELLERAYAELCKRFADPRKIKNLVNNSPPLQQLLTA